MHPAPLILAAVTVLAVTATSSISSSLGCGTSAPIPLSTRYNATTSASNRTYLYFLPATYDPNTPTPLILSFHGGGQTADLQADLDELTNPYFNVDHILVYPQALQLGKSTADISWQGSPGTGNVDDIGYVADVLDDLGTKLCIDLTRIYATGKSEGGGMAGVLACDYNSSQRIAAFAAVAGAFYLGAVNCSDPDTVPISCDAGRSGIPILEFHGGNDTTISIDGGERKGYCLPAIGHWIDDWDRRDNILVSALAVESLPGTALVRRYGTGNESGLVTWVYSGDSVNHDWPATFPNTDNIKHDSGPATFNASTIIMNWFAEYTLPLEDVCLSQSSKAIYSTSTVAACTTNDTAPKSAGNRDPRMMLTKDRLPVAATWAFIVYGLILL